MKALQWYHNFSSRLNMLEDLPLLLIRLVLAYGFYIPALVTVYLGHGFNAGDNRLEIPLYYILMLMILFVKDAGKFSLDRIIDRRIGS